jgi:hypothetical protein
MAPKGQTILQNGRLLTIINAKNIANNTAFQEKSHPNWLRRSSIKKTSGNPASNVPAGHTNLQNHVCPYPNSSTIKSGKIMTNTSRKAYLRYDNILGMEILGERIL